MPKEIRNQKPFFFIDTLKKVEGRVYQVKVGAKSYVTADDEISNPTEDGIKWNYKVDEETILINPDIEPNGGARVYIQEYILGNKLDLEKNGKKKHFFYRTDLILIQ